MFLARESLVSDIPAGDGKFANLFLHCGCYSGWRWLLQRLNDSCGSGRRMLLHLLTAAAAVVERLSSECCSGGCFSGWWWLMQYLTGVAAVAEGQCCTWWVVASVFAWGCCAAVTNGGYSCCFSGWTAGLLLLQWLCAGCCSGRDKGCCKLPLVTVYWSSYTVKKS